MYVYIVYIHLCMYMYLVYACREQKVPDTVELGVTGSCEPPCVLRIEHRSSARATATEAGSSYL